MTTLEEILENWKTDAPIERDELGRDAAVTPKLHQKYLALRSTEKMKLRFLESKFKKLKLQKYEHYTHGASKETQAKGWKVPSVGRILKTDSPIYLDGDDELSEAQLKIDYAKEKVDTLDAIITQINGRSYLIGHAIADMRWKGGS